MANSTRAGAKGRIWYIVVGGIATAVCLLLVSVILQFSSLIGQDAVDGLNTKVADLETKLSRVSSLSDRRNSEDDWVAKGDAIDLKETNLELRQLYHAAQEVIDTQHKQSVMLGIRKADEEKVSLPPLGLFSPSEEQALLHENMQLSQTLEVARGFINTNKDILGKHRAQVEEAEAQIKVGLIAEALHANNATGNVTSAQIMAALKSIPQHDFQD